jgi:hypothetical protein
MYALILGGIFGIIMYQLVLSDTVELSSRVNDMQQEVMGNIDAPVEIQELKTKLMKIEQLIGDSTQTSEEDVHQLLLESVTHYCQQKGIILNDFPKPFEKSENGFTTHTAKVTVEGDFINLLKLVYYLEKNYQVGKVVAVDFEATKNLRTRKRELHSTIYLQNVKSTPHEENS